MLETIDSLDIDKPEPLIEPDKTPEIVVNDNIKTLPLINFGIGKLTIKLIIEKQP